jgi:hypothetical protein
MLLNSETLILLKKKKDRKSVNAVFYNEALSSSSTFQWAADTEGTVISLLLLLYTQKAGSRNVLWANNKNTRNCRQQPTFLCMRHSVWPDLLHVRRWMSSRPQGRSFEDHACRTSGRHSCADTWPVTRARQPCHRAVIYITSGLAGASCRAVTLRQKQWFAGHLKTLYQLQM